ncbi:MAG: ribosomal protein S18-alanine N-acetyltransferase [Ruminococcus sp.]|nr:ribosomal protein S18-alanine N-acetyltransferase [Ruminococcus sp.]
MKIEKMTKAHLDSVCLIEEKCFSHPWSRNSLESELENENSVFYVCIQNDVVVGYIGMNFVLDEGYIFNVAVDEKYRKMGIGSALIDALVTYAKHNNFYFLTLEVRESNAAAISLYSKFGFEKVGERKDYYSSPKENAILMTKYF